MWYNEYFKKWHLEIAEDHYEKARQDLLDKGYKEIDKFHFVYDKLTAHMLKYPEWDYPIYPPRILYGMR